MYRPLRSQLGSNSIDVFVHGLLLDRITNPRSKEIDDKLDPAEFFRVAPACRYSAEDQEEVDYLSLIHI